MQTLMLKGIVLGLIMGLAGGVLPATVGAQNRVHQDVTTTRDIDPSLSDRAQPLPALNDKDRIPAAAPITLAAVDHHPVKQSPDYWYDRGGLQSAYGAYQAAAQSYRKAIAMAPQYADAHFQLGVAYGELHQFEAAIKAMTQAIDLSDDQHARYYYGRGRVYLLAGEENQAMRDFMEAGFRGHSDACAYLQDAGVTLQ